MIFFIVRKHIENFKRSFSVRVVNAWNTLPEEVVMSASLTLFKKNFSGALGLSLYEFL